jgi:hypothetical protein
MRNLPIFAAMMVALAVAGPLTLGDHFAALESRQSGCPNPNDNFCINPEGNVLDLTTGVVYVSHLPRTA